MKFSSVVRWVFSLTVLLNILSWDAQMAMWRDPRTFERKGWGYSNAKIEYRDYMFNTHFLANAVLCFTICAIIYLIVLSKRHKKHLKWDDLLQDDEWKRAERNFDTPSEPSAEEIASEDALQRQYDLEASNIDNYVPNVKDSVGLATPNQEKETEDDRI